MQPLNAIDAIAPAFARTRETLFAPFRVRASWRLAAGYFLASWGGIFVPIPMLVFLIPAHVLVKNDARLRLEIYAVAAVLTVVMVAVLYVCSRMELVGFEMLVTRSQTIRATWRKYGSVVWPWIGLKIASGSVLTVVAALLAYRPVWRLVMAVASNQNQNDPALGETIVGAIFAFSGGYLLFLLVAKTLATVLTDFVLPFYVLERLSVGAAVGRAWRMVAADQLQFAGYVLMKPLLGFLGYLMLSVGVQLCVSPVVVILAAVGAVGSIAVRLAHSTVLSVLSGALVGMLGVCFFAAYAFLILGMFGYFMALMQSYGITFVAGRYPLLATMMSAGPGEPFTPPPVFPSREEDDDDGGPPMPMNPAVA
jgi:hypothetical protein